MYPCDADPREFGPDPEDERCPDCGAAWDQDCTADCACAFCVQRRALIELEMAE